MSGDPKDAAQQAAAELEERKSQFEYANGGVGSFRLDQGAGAGIIERHIEGRCFDPAHAQWTEFMDKHPGMCCGYCAQAIDAALERAKAAEQERDHAREQGYKHVDYIEELEAKLRASRAGYARLKAKVSDWAQAKAMTELIGGSGSYADLERQANELALRAEAAEQRAEEALAALRRALDPNSVSAMSYNGKLYPINSTGMRQVVDDAVRLRRERDEATAKLKEARVMLRRMTQIVVNEFSVDPGHVESYRNVKAYQYDVDAALAALDAPAKPE